jgi:hypothetical protein
MEPFQFLGEAGNENDITVTIFYLVSNSNDVTVTFCGNDAHLWLLLSANKISRMDKQFSIVKYFGMETPGKHTILPFSIWKKTNVIQKYYGLFI